MYDYDNDGRKAVTLAYEEIPIQRDMPYRLNIKVIGDHIEVRVNGRKVLNAIDPSYDHGDEVIDQAEFDEAEIKGYIIGGATFGDIDTSGDGKIDVDEFSAALGTYIQTGTTYDMINVVGESGQVAFFTGKETKATFDGIKISELTPFDLLTQDTKGVAINLIKKLDTLSRTRNFDEITRVNGDDRLVFEMIGDGRADLIADTDIDWVDLAKINLAANFCVRNPSTNKFAGDINLDNRVNMDDVALILKLKVLTDNVNAQGYITQVLGVDAASALSRLHELSKKASGADFISALADDNFTFKDLEFLIRYADVTGDGVVNFRDRDRIVRGEILYNFLFVNRAGMEAIRYDTRFAGLDLDDFENWTSTTQDDFVASLLDYLTEIAGTNPILRDFDNNGTFTTTADGNNTEVSGFISITTHEDGSQTKVFFNSSGDVLGTWYIEPDKRPVYIQTVTVTETVVNGDGSKTYYTRIDDDGGYMNVTVKDGAVKSIYMMKTDFRDKYIWDAYRNGRLEITPAAIVQAMHDRRDLNGDTLFTIDSIGGEPTDLDLLNELFSLTHEASTMEELDRMDVDGNGAFEDADMELYEELMVYMVDLDNDNDVDMYDLLELKKAIIAESTDPLYDLNDDTVVDDKDYKLLEEAIGAIKDINADGTYDQNDIDEMLQIYKFEQERELIELADINKDNYITQADIDKLERIRTLDVNGDEIIRSFVNGAGGPEDWSNLKEIKDKLEESHNKDWIVEGIMADLDLTLELFEALDKNGDGVFDILDLTEGIDPYHFHDYDIFRRHTDEGILSFYDEYLIHASMRNLKFLNYFDDEIVKKADVNGDGVIDFEDYHLLSNAYNVLYPSGVEIPRDIDLSGDDLPDTADLEALRYLAVLLRESDVNGDGFRDYRDEQFILTKMGTYNTRYDTSGLLTSDFGSDITRFDDGSLAMEYLDIDGGGDFHMKFNMNVAEKGYYYVGVSARALSAISIPEDGVYEFKVLIDGQVVKEDDGTTDKIISVMGSTHQYNDGAIRIYREQEGNFEVTFEWVNADQKMMDLDRDKIIYELGGHFDPDEIVKDTLQVKEAFLYTEGFDDRADLTKDGGVTQDDLTEFKQALTAYAEYRRADINGDGRVDEKDRQAFENGSDISSTVWNQIVTIDGTTYNVRYNKDKDVYTINGKSNEMGSNIIEINGKDYLILEDIDGEARFVEKLDADITGALGEPDGNVDLWDWALMTSRITNPPLRKVGADTLDAYEYLRDWWGWQDTYEIGGMPVEMRFNSSIRGMGAMYEDEYSAGITRVGNNMVKNAGGVAAVTYSFDIREICEEGYEFGLHLKHLGTLPQPGYQYHFDVFIDGQEVKGGTIVADPSSEYQFVSTHLDKKLFGEGENVLGTHTVMVVIDSQDAIEADEVFLREADHRADINNDGFSDMLDYEIFRKEFATDRNIRSVKIDGYTKDSYIIRNDDLTYTLFMIDETTNMVKPPYQSDKDGKIIRIDGTDYVIYVPKRTTEVYLTELTAADVNYDGTVDWKDEVVYQRMYIDQSPRIMTTNYAGTIGSWQQVGDGMETASVNSVISYQVDIKETGKYVIGMDALNTLSGSGGNYELAVYLDGERQTQEMLVGRSNEDYQYGFTELYMLEGTHNIAFEWVNTMADTKLLIKDLHVFDKRLDLVRDSKLDILDVEAFREQRVSTANIDKISFEGTDYFVRSNHDGTFTLLDASYNDLYTSGLDGIMLAGSGKKLIAKKSASGDTLISELLLQDINNDETVNLADLALIQEQSALDNVMQTADRFTKKSGTGFEYTDGGIRFGGTDNTAYLEYEIDVQESGMFDIGASIEDFAQAGYVANIAVTIELGFDDQEQPITMTKYLRFASGETQQFAVFELAKGKHKVRIAWDNRDVGTPPAGGIVFKKLYARGQQVDLMTDMNGDGIVDVEDINAWYDLVPLEGRAYEVGSYFVVKRAGGTYDVYDTNGTRYPSDAEGRYVDIGGALYVIGYDSVSDTIMLSDWKSSDVTIDGIIDLSDKESMAESAALHSSIISVDTSNETEANYKFYMPYGGGTFDAVIQLQGSGAVHDFYKFDIEVTVDGAVVGLAKVDYNTASEEQMIVSLGELSKRLPESKNPHTIKLKWKNKNEYDAGDAVLWGDLVLRDSAINIDGDLDGNGIVDNVDVRMWHALAPEEANSRKAVLHKADSTQEDLYIRVNLDGTFSVFDQAGAVIGHTVVGASYVMIGGIRFDISYDTDTEEVNLVEHVDPDEATEDVKRLQIGTEMFSIYPIEESAELAFVSDAGAVYTTWGGGRAVAIGSDEYIVSYSLDEKEIIVADHLTADVTYDGVLDDADSLLMDMNAYLENNSFAINDNIDNIESNIYTVEVDYSYDFFDLEFQGEWLNGVCDPEQKFQIQIIDTSSGVDKLLDTITVAMTEDGQLRGMPSKPKKIAQGTYELKLRWANRTSMRNWQNPDNNYNKDNENLELHITDFALRDSRVDLVCDVDGDLAVTTDDVLIFEGSMPQEGRVTKFTGVGTGNRTLYIAKLRNHEYYIIEHGTEPATAVTTEKGIFSLGGDTLVIEEDQNGALTILKDNQVSGSEAAED